jgi:hypothetical protein
MTTLDWIILAFIVLMAVWGYLQGLVVSAFSLGGFAVGALIGTRVAPLLLAKGSSSPYAPLVTLVTALMLGALAAVALEAVGEGIRRRLSFPAADVVDKVGGALLVAALGVALVWIAGAVALQTPGASRFRRDIQRSTILADVNKLLPPSGPILNALARFDPVPQIPGSAADVRRPSRRILRDPDVRRRSDSTRTTTWRSCRSTASGRPSCRGASMRPPASVWRCWATRRTGPTGRPRDGSGRR